ncbi:hypothetical protein CCHL11_02062 [Colletotrichum chlorophyti]|uniref:C2H2-type domain-containing protein n=1 Tax=Colletotrichum chlorophyti TaxID=708187 RepID=A0A1Q8S6M8_9PEZI|nr:hypothetical protein CCHL11_02062 [Colletotrichum chlorophyti]
MAPPAAAKRPHAAVGTANTNIDPWSDTPFANFDCSKYDYMPTDDGGFWKLQQNYASSEQLPNVIPLVATSRSPVQKTQDIEWTCLSAACPSKPFKKKADLDRHYKQAHTDSQTQPSPALSLKDITPATSISNPSPKISTKSKASGTGNAKGGTGGGASGSGPGNRNNSVSTGKDKDGVFCCDYPACNRKADPFNRKDRLRTHMAEVHKEDVKTTVKNGDMTPEWFATRKIYYQWWRCPKCLERIKVEENGWECPNDGGKCEDKRREFREKLRQEEQGM